MNKAKSNGYKIVKFGELLLFRLDNFSFNPLRGERKTYGSSCSAFVRFSRELLGPGEEQAFHHRLCGARTVAGSGRLSTESQVSIGSHRIEKVHKPPVVEVEDGTQAAGSKLSRLSDWPVSLVTGVYTCNFQATYNKTEKKRRHSLSRIKTGHGNKNM